MKHFGVLVPIVTPCSKTGEIDKEGLQSVCKEMLDAGNKGIFVLGSTGRGPWFSRTDRAKICNIVADYIGPDVPLFAGCMANGLRDMIDNSYFLRDAGAQYAVVTAPGYFQYLPHEVEVILKQFADHSPIPVLLYDVPVYVGSAFNIDSIVRLIRHPNVIGLKDSTSNFNRFKKLANELKDFDQSYLFQGKENSAAASLLAGASGLISTFSNFCPKMFVELCEAAVRQDIQITQKIQHDLTELYDLVTECLTGRPGISTLFHIVNIILQKRGVCQNIMLEHEGDCPDWLKLKTGEIVEICEAF